MTKMPIAIAGILALASVNALAQTPSSGAQDGATTNQPVCSSADAARVKAGQRPSTPCRVDSSADGDSAPGSAMPNGSTTPNGSPPAPQP